MNVDEHILNRRKAALDEANYSVCAEIANGNFRPTTSADLEEYTLLRAAVFEHYLANGLESGLEQTRLALTSRKGVRS